MIGQGFAGGLEFAIPIGIIGLVVVAIVALVTARRDPDPSGSRPYAIYLVLVIFFAMFTALFSITAAASNVVRIPLTDESSGCVAGSVVVPCPSATPSATPAPTASGIPAIPHPVTVSRFDPDHVHTSDAVAAALVALVAFGVLWFHVRRLRELVSEPGFDRAPGRRTYQVYLHAVSFTAAAILIFAGAAALFGLFRILAPDITNQLSPESLERDAGIAQLVAAGVLAIGAWVIFRYHWHRTTTLRGEGPLPPGDRAARPGPRHAAPSQARPHSSPPPTPPPAPPVSEEPPPPAIPPT